MTHFESIEARALRILACFTPVILSEAIEARARRILACFTPVILSEAKDLIRIKRERAYSSFRMTDSQLLHPYPAVLPDND